MTKRFRNVAVVSITRLAWKDGEISRLSLEISKENGWLNVILQPMKSLDSDKCNRGSQQGAVVCVEVHKTVQEPFQEQHSEVTTTAGQSLTWACVYEVTDCSLQNEVFYLLCFCSNKLNFQDISNARINNTYLPYTDQQDMEQRCLAGPDTYKPGGIGHGSEGQRQAWLQEPWDGGD